MTEVYPNVYLGNRKIARNHNIIQELGITHVLNVTKEVKNYYEYQHNVPDSPLNENEIDETVITASPKDKRSMSQIIDDLVDDDDENDENDNNDENDENEDSNDSVLIEEKEPKKESMDQISNKPKVQTNNLESTQDNCMSSSSINVNENTFSKSLSSSSSCSNNCVSSETNNVSENEMKSSHSMEIANQVSSLHITSQENTDDPSNDCGTENNTLSTPNDSSEPNDSEACMVSQQQTQNDRHNDESTAISSNTTHSQQESLVDPSTKHEQLHDINTADTQMDSVDNHQTIPSSLNTKNNDADRTINIEENNESHPSENINSVEPSSVSSSQDSSSPKEKNSDLTYCRIAIEDSIEVPISRYFEEALDFMNRALDNDGKLLVHCREGRSRSVTMLVMLGICRFKMDLNRAFENIQQKTAGHTRINDGFKRQLMELEMDHRGDQSIDFLPKRRRVESYQNLDEALDFLDDIDDDYDPSCEQPKRKKRRLNNGQKKKKKNIPQMSYADLKKMFEQQRNTKTCPLFNPPKSKDNNTNSSNNSQKNDNHVIVDKENDPKSGQPKKSVSHNTTPAKKKNKNQATLTSMFSPGKASKSNANKKTVSRPANQASITSFFK
eukprot:gb/GECH01007440.1/.p1 GENE.gb/GECH01007440.1/~~gb/GECH01007440.1/.p1  ORF type:complete len:613 (+),score=154.35 gb/GECH01007440.1/:1-1839(+)